MAPHSSTLAWKIPWMEEPGRLQSMGSLKVGHDWATSLWLLTFMHWRDCCWPKGHNCSLFFSPISILTCPHPLPPPLLVLVADLVGWLKLSFLRDLRSLSARVVLLVSSQSQLGRKELKSTPSGSPELPMDSPPARVQEQPNFSPNKGVYSQIYGFSSNHVWMWELNHKEGWALKNWCFWTLVLEKTLESPLDSKEIKPVDPKGNQSWNFIGRTDAEADAPIFWPPDAKSQLTGKDLNAGKNWRQEEKGMTKDEMVRWHHWFNACKFEQTQGDSEGQGTLACCNPWGRKELDMA